MRAFETSIGAIDRYIYAASVAYLLVLFWFRHGPDLHLYSIEACANLFVIGTLL